MRVFQTPKFSHPNFSFFLRRSTYIHLALVLSTLISGKIAFDLAEEKRNENLELIQASVRVDMVAMPTHTIAELKNISSGTPDAKVEVSPAVETKAEVKEEVAEAQKETGSDDVEAFEKASTEKRADFLNQLKKISNTKLPAQPAKKPEAGKKQEEKGLSGQSQTALKNLVLSGNRLSQGTALHGDGGSGNLTAFQAYTVRLPDLVRPHWKLPSFLMDKNLQCRIRVWLSSSGEVTKVTVYQSSGDSEYDQRAVDAVRSASPFPRLTEEHGNRAQNGDILLGFPL